MSKFHSFLITFFISDMLFKYMYEMNYICYRLFSVLSNKCYHHVTSFLILWYTLWKLDYVEVHSCP